MITALQTTMMLDVLQVLYRVVFRFPALSIYLNMNVCAGVGGVQAQFYGRSKICRLSVVQSRSCSVKELCSHPTDSPTSRSSLEP